MLPWNPEARMQVEDCGRTGDWQPYDPSFTSTSLFNSRVVTGHDISPAPIPLSIGYAGMNGLHEFPSIWRDDTNI